MAKEVRHIAFQVLSQSREARTTLDRALDRARPDLDQLSRPDRNLCNAIIFGVLRHQGRLDQLIRHFSHTPFEKLDTPVRIILRIGSFQLIFLERVPDFAAIHTSIELAKAALGKKRAGFINALLRQVAQGHETVSLPDPRKNLAAHLRDGYSLPAWLGKRWIRAFGREKTLALAQAVMEIPPITLRVNTLKTDRQQMQALLAAKGIGSEENRISPVGLDITHPGMAISDLDGYDQGFFQVQDEAAQLVSQILEPGPGDRVLDACAGLGTKTCHMAQLMENRGEVVAADISASKLANLADEAQRLGISIIKTRDMDIRHANIKRVDGFFDRVLVDAPCSGLGVMRRNPDSRWKRAPEDVRRMAGQQKKILNAAANLVRPGGILVYAVCSCEPEENEAIIQAFLNKRRDFQTDQIPVSLFGRPGSHMLKTYPDHLWMDGFFAARLKRLEK